MPDIILMNDQDQEQTLTGVEKLVVRSESGDVEYSLGGSGAESDFFILSAIRVPGVDGDSPQGVLFGKTWTYAASPAKGTLTLDMPSCFKMLSTHAGGHLSYTIKNADTGDTTGTRTLIYGEEITQTIVDESTNRLSTKFSISWENGTALQLQTKESYIAFQALVDGVSLREVGEKFILSGANAGKAMQFMWGTNALDMNQDYSYINEYDLSADATDIEITTAALTSLPALEVIRFSSGSITWNMYALSDCPNLALLDYSQAVSVQACPVPVSTHPKYYPKLKVYVPSSLYSQWVANTSWSKLADKIVAV